MGYGVIAFEVNLESGVEVGSSRRTLRKWTRHG